MKFLVASFFLIASVALAGTTGLGQTTHRGVTNGPAKPRAETLKICQGLPLPDGYIIIGYMTSSVCPHGAYLLKKQEVEFQPSAAANRNVQPANAGAKPKVTSAQSTNNSSQSARISSQPGEASASASRPRRVGTSVSPNAQVSQSAPVSQNAAGSPDSPVSQNVPPTLIGGEPAAALRPPTLAGAGAAGESVITPSNKVSAPGPEEVGEGDVVRVDTTLVAVPVSVLDRQGRFVPNLRREDFSIFENGIEQSIAYFEPAEKPFTVALLLDTSPSTHFHLSDIREAAIAFAKQLRPQDRVLVVSFNDEVLLLTEVTNDLNIIETVIEENANTGNSTRLYDAVDLVIKERLNKIRGRKAIVLFTDGVDTSSRLATYQSTLHEVEELDALIYPVQYDTTDYLRAMQGAGSGTVTIVTRTSNWPFPGTSSSQTTQTVPLNGGVPLPGATKAEYDRADQYLHGLAEKTGGRVYQANDLAQLSEAFSRIAEELRRQYSLGYYPRTATVENGERRQIKVHVHQPNLAVKARDSYVKPSSTNSPQ